MVSKLCSFFRSSTFPPTPNEKPAGSLTNCFLLLGIVVSPSRPSFASFTAEPFSSALRWSILLQSPISNPVASCSEIRVSSSPLEGKISYFLAFDPSERVVVKGGGWDKLEERLEGLVGLGLDMRGDRDRLEISNMLSLSWLSIPCDDGSVMVLLSSPGRQELWSILQQPLCLRRTLFFLRKERQGGREELS